MKSGNDQSGNPELLRRKAEELSLKSAAGSLERLAQLPIEETSRVVHELRVHQIELEIQNEALRQPRAEREEKHEQYVDLYDFAPAG